MLRINDTRLYHEFTTNYVLREYTNRECSFQDVKLPLNVFGNPNILSPHMPIRTSTYEKLIFTSNALNLTSKDSSASTSQ